jgi:hypothetical protein
VPVTGQYVDIALGSFDTGCAVAVDGSVECWGGGLLVDEVPADLRVF